MDSAHWELAAGTQENLVLATLIIPVIYPNTPLLFCLNPFSFESLTLLLRILTSETSFSPLHQKLHYGPLLQLWHSEPLHSGHDFAFIHPHMCKNKSVLPMPCQLDSLPALLQLVEWKNYRATCPCSDKLSPVKNTSNILARLLTTQKLNKQTENKCKIQITLRRLFYEN